jgi:SAM-dependent methyltransferase
LNDSFDFIYDGGTLEHVYNFPVAIESCMKLCRVGGHVCLWTPANNECGHGFYQFSPELFFRLFSADNGFRIRAMVLVERNLRGTRWYEVNDPAALNARVCCVNRHPLFLMVLAQKRTSVPASDFKVLQADYVSAWEGKDRPGTVVPGKPSESMGDKIKSLLKTLHHRLPPEMASLLLGWYSTYYVRRLGNRTFYRRIRPNDYSIVPSND